MSDVTRMKCGKASASEAGGEIFQVLFEANPEQEDGPYVLIQRAWLEEDERASSPCYVETHDERLIGHYMALEVELARNRLTLQLPPPTDERNRLRDVGRELQRDPARARHYLSAGSLRGDQEECPLTVLHRARTDNV